MDVALTAALIGAAAALLAAAVPRLVERHERHRGRQVTVRHIADPGDPDVAVALRLLERRLPPSERDEPEDIVRWMLEVRDEKRRGVCQLEDYFLVGRVGDDVAGFAYVQYYPSAALAFYSYLVIDETIPEARECHVSTALLRSARKALFGLMSRCRGVVLEVEEPEILRGRSARTAAARIRHFRTLARSVGIPLKEVGIDYRQPRLRVSQAESEDRMRLMYAPRRWIGEPRALSRNDVADILTFLAEQVYGDQFEHEMNTNSRYREYLYSWKKNLLSQTPGVVPLV